MATINVVLRKRENKDGTRPLTIRITKDRKSSTIHTGYSLNSEDWDETKQRVKKSHVNSARLNNLIASKVAEAREKSLEIEANNDRATASVISQSIKPKSSALFFAQSQVYLDFLKGRGSYTSHETEKSRLRIFKEFLNEKDISFSEITTSLLEKFYLHLRSKRNLAERTAMNYLILIRTIYNRAINDGLADRKYYPFGDGKTPIKLPDSTKIGSERSDVEKLEKVILENPSHDHARNLWLFSFYFAGMRISDVLRLRWSDFQGDRLHYTMGKNQKPGSFKIPEKAQAILGKYKSQKTGPDDLVFPDLKTLQNLDDPFEVKRRISFVVTNLDKIMRTQIRKIAGIDAKMSMHISRHTFATLAGDKVPVQILQKMYRHSDIKTTIGYQANFINQDTDDALDAVLNG
jgi:integrase